MGQPNFDLDEGVKIMQLRKRLKIIPVSFVALGILLALAAVACGSAAAPETIIEERVVEKEVVVEVVKEVVKEVEVMVVATPTPVPIPVGGFKLVDKFTIMVTSQGNEIFNNKYQSGENNLWMRLAHVWLVGGAFKDGTLVLDPTFSEVIDYIETYVFNSNKCLALFK